MGMYYTPSEGGLESHYCAMWRSHDRGLTWTDEVLMSAKHQYLAQPTVVKLPNRVLRAFYRDRRGRFIYTSDSTNDGRTWPNKHRKTGLPNNQSGIQALVLANGHVVMAFNNQKCLQGHPLRCHRHPLSVALSTD